MGWKCLALEAWPGWHWRLHEDCFWACRSPSSRLAESREVGRASSPARMHRNCATHRPTETQPSVTPANSQHRAGCLVLFGFGLRSPDGLIFYLSQPAVPFHRPSLHCSLVIFISPWVSRVCCTRPSLQSLFSTLTQCTICLQQQQQPPPPPPTSNFQRRID
jgi:hypothetical protein